MLLFGKKVEIYAGKDEAQFEAIKRRLKESKIRFGTGWTQSEIVGGCGCKINVKQIANPNYTPFTWYIFVRPQDEARARALVENVAPAK